MSTAQTLIDYNGWKKRAADLRAQGRCVGVGLATCQERGVYGPTEWWSLNNVATPGFTLTSTPEGMLLRIDPTGKVFATLNAVFIGNSPESIVTQVLAEQLCVPPSDIVVGYADTHSGFNGVGPQGSRFATMITGACVSASYKIKAKLKLLAGHLLEASVDRLELRNGAVGIKGSERQVAIADIAMQANFFRLNFPDKPEFDSGLETTAVYDHPISTLPHPERKHLGVFYPMMGHVCHIAVVEVNPQTGKVGILDYAAAHDNGTIVNPQTLGGQVLGGTANGIGTTLLEEFIYDETGQFLNPNFAEFSLPSAYEMPANLKIGHVETPSPYSEYGVKGGGEGGRLGAPSALTSAIEDALRAYGVKIHAIPVRPSKLRELIRAAQS